MSETATKHTTTFTCCDQEFQPGDPIRNHLKEKHGITDFKGTRSLVLALDGDEYCNVYEYKIGGVAFTKTCKGPK